MPTCGSRHGKLLAYYFSGKLHIVNVSKVKTAPRGEEESGLMKPV